MQAYPLPAPWFSPTTQPRGMDPVCSLCGLRDEKRNLIRICSCSIVHEDCIENDRLSRPTAYCANKCSRCMVAYQGIPAVFITPVRFYVFVAIDLLLLFVFACFIGLACARFVQIIDTEVCRDSETPETCLLRYRFFPEDWNAGVVYGICGMTLELAIFAVWMMIYRCVSSPHSSSSSSSYGSNGRSNYSHHDSSCCICIDSGGGGRSGSGRSSGGGDCCSGGGGGSGNSSSSEGVPALCVAMVVVFAVFGIFYAIYAIGDTVAYICKRHVNKRHVQAVVYAYPVVGEDIAYAILA